MFDPSKFFAPWLEAERAIRAKESKRRHNRRKHKELNLKIGHGGTLDPMATGVLIVGVGRGTKVLQHFLSCTKSYEATVLFGAATDTYDVLGNILGKAPYAHLTNGTVSQALRTFRGKIMQRPPLYSALRVQGKRLYEYARNGEEVPVEIQERPVEVKELEILEWLDGSEHNYRWPAEQAMKEDKEVAEKILHLDEVAIASGSEESKDKEALPYPQVSAKRKRPPNDEPSNPEPPPKRQEGDSQTDKVSPPEELHDQLSGPSSPNPPNSAVDLKMKPSASPTPETHVRPPAVKLRMTVTSGFYVRSLSHDLGKRVGSFGIMSELVRTRQGQFSLGQNTLEYEDLAKGEEVWAPKLGDMLDRWNEGLV